MPAGQPGRGHAYQWGACADGSFGQGIFIDPKRRIVIVFNAN